MEESKEDLKWFGEGFDGFPKALPDACAEYVLFVVDPKLDEFALRNRLREVQKTSSNFVKKLLKNYIWQHDGFSLELVHDNGSKHFQSDHRELPGRGFLRGRTNYGDCVEDEWLAVYLIRELSKQFGDLWIKVVDNDGEFLLIEAANTLPRWLNPEIADNRVWINRGNLYIIPPDSRLSHDAKAKSPISNITLEDAISFISLKQSQLVNSPLIQEEAFYRLRNYPDQIGENLHHALVTLPRKLAFVLRENSAYISPAIEAFYLRDPIAMKPLSSTDFTTLMFPPQDLVTVSVAFNKVGYAQVKSQQQFSTPASWHDALKLVTTPKSIEEITTGIRVTSGFEMLMADKQNQDKRPVREINMLLSDLESGDAHLPTDTEISTWPKNEDSEAWLDIDFRDFERELEGKGQKGKEAFNDRTAQENLRKIVSRFEDFLNDDSAGIDGAEFSDEMDNDNDDAFSNEFSDSDLEEEEDKEVSFDEKEFARMMREMMGLPAEESPSRDETSGKEISKTENNADSESDDDRVTIGDVMRRMETELNNAGALNLDPTPRKLDAARSRVKQKAIESEEKAEAQTVSSEGEESEEGEINVDFNLARNLLESFKSQAGVAGPTGNLMSLMGIGMPRDEDDAGPSK